MIKRIQDIKVSRLLLAAFTMIVLIFIVAPIIVLTIVSFSSTNILQFPPPELSFRWYESYLGDTTWRAATVRSIIVALLTAFFSFLIGFPAAIGIVRSNFKGKNLIRVFTLTPLAFPKIIIAIGLYFLYVKAHIVGTMVGLVIGHTLIALPFTILVLTAGLQGIDERLEWAAQNLGATQFQTFTKITIPMLWPSIVASLIFCFIESFDDIILSMFLSSVSKPTLPVQIWISVQQWMDPTIAAVSVILLLITIVGLLLISLVNKQMQKFN